jgi:hypothetical protein
MGQPSTGENAGQRERRRGRGDEEEWVLLMVCTCANAPFVKKNHLLFERPP